MTLIPPVVDEEREELKRVLKERLYANPRFATASPEKQAAAARHLAQTIRGLRVEDRRYDDDTPGAPPAYRALRDATVQEKIRWLRTGKVQEEEAPAEPAKAAVAAPEQPRPIAEPWTYGMPPKGEALSARLTTDEDMAQVAYRDEGGVFGQFAAGTGEVAGRAITQVGRRIERPFSLGLPGLYNLIAEQFGQPAPLDLETFPEAGKDIIAAGKAVTEYSQQAVPAPKSPDSLLGYLTDPGNTANIIARSLPYTAGVMGATVAGGPVAGYLFAYGQEWENFYDSTTERLAAMYPDMSADEIHRIGSATADLGAPVSALIEYVSAQGLIDLASPAKKALVDAAIKKILAKTPDWLIKASTSGGARVAFGSMIEGVQEVFQGSTEELAQLGLADLPIEAGFWRRRGDELIIGGLTGALIEGPAQVAAGQSMTDVDATLAKLNETMRQMGADAQARTETPPWLAEEARAEAEAPVKPVEAEAPEAGVAAPEGKQAWEMTLEEFSAYEIPLVKDEARFPQIAIVRKRLEGAGIQIDEIGVTGSQAAGVGTPTSDVDIYVKVPDSQYDQADDLVASLIGEQEGKIDVLVNWRGVGKPGGTLRGGKTHRRIVEQALKDGKPVPSSVLAEYPELAEKYGKQPAAPKKEAAAAPVGADTKAQIAELHKKLEATEDIDEQGLLVQQIVRLRKGQAEAPAQQGQGKQATAVEPEAEPEAPAPAVEPTAPVEEEAPAPVAEQPARVPLKTDIESLNAATWHHGTGAKIMAKDLDPTVGDPQALMGMGVYMTDSGGVAEGYQEVRSRGKGGKVIRAKVNLAKVLNMEEPMPADARQALLAEFTEELENYFVYHDDPPPENATGQQVLSVVQKAVSEHSYAMEYDAIEYAEKFLTAAENLKRLGYDALYYTGGKRTKGAPHRVIVVLDPQDVAQIGRPNPITDMEEAPPEAAPQPAPEARVITDAAYNKAKDTFKGTTPSSLGAAQIEAAVTIGAYHVENGLRTFAEWSRKMVEEVGEAIKPRLQEIWEAVKELREGTPWEETKAGKPVTLYGYRGEGVSGALTGRAQGKLGREYLLGDGLYIAPTKRLSEHFGTARTVRIRLQNPYVVEQANEATIKALDLEEIKRNGHDGIIIKRGQAGFGRGQEDLKQAVLFKPTSENAQLDVVAPKPSSVRKGATVRVESVKGKDEYIDTYRKGVREIVGKEGVVTAMFGDNPSVKVGGKVYQMNRGEVVAVEQPDTGARAVSESSYQSALKHFAARNIARSGITGEDIKASVTIGSYHFENGARAFVGWARKMVADIGEWIRPKLRSIWQQVQAFHKSEEGALKISGEGKGQVRAPREGGITPETLKGTVEQQIAAAVSETGKVKTPMARRLAKGVKAFGTAVFNQQATEKRFARIAGKIKPFGVGEDPHKINRVLTKAAPAWARDSLDNGVKSFITGQRMGPSVRSAFEKLGPLTKEKLTLFGHYVYVRSALERIAENPKYNAGATPAAIEGFYAKYSEVEGFEEAAKIYTQFHKSLVAMLCEAGRISLDRAGAVIESLPAFAPLMRMVEEFGRGTSGAAQGQPGMPIGRRTKTGSGKQVINPLVATMKMAQQFYQAAALTIAQRAVIETAEARGMSDWVRAIDAPADAALTESIIKQLQDAGLKDEPMTADKLRSMLQAAHDKGIAVVPYDLIEPFKNVKHINFVFEGNEVVVSSRTGKTELDRFGLSADTKGWESRIRVPSAMNIMAALMQANNYSRNKDNRIIVYGEDGKAQWYELDPELHQAVMNTPVWAGSPLFTSILRYGSIPTKIKRVGATGLRLAFGVYRNPIRDLATYMIRTEQKTPQALGNYLAAYLHQAKDAIASLTGGAGDPVARLYSEMGGEAAQLIGQDMSVGYKTFQEWVKTGEMQKTKGVGARVVLKGKQILGDPLHTRPVHLLQQLIGATEKTPRMAELWGRLEQLGYTREMMEAGIDPTPQMMIEATYAAMNITNDFSAAGSMGRVMNKMNAFWNAKMRDIATDWEVAKNNPSRTLLRGTLMLTLPTLALWWRHKDEDWYKEAPAWLKNTCWLIPIGGGKYIPIPRPFLLGTIFASIPEAIFDAAYRQNPESMKDIGSTMFGEYAPNMQDLLPDAVEPAMEAFGVGPQGYDYFRARPVVSDQLAARPAREQKYDYNTSFSKYIGWKLGISPAKLDHAISGYTGGLGTDVLRIPQEGPWRALLGSGIIKDREAVKSTNEFYEKSKEIGQEYTSALDAAKAGGAAHIDDVKLSAEHYRYRRLQEVMADIRAVYKGETDTEKLNEKVRYINGLARAALGKEPLVRYPNMFETGISLPRSLVPIRRDFLASLARTVDSSTVESEKASFASRREARRRRDEALALLTALGVSLIRARRELARQKD